MLPSTLFSTVRRGLLAAFAVICLLGFAAPASAGPTCTVDNPIAVGGAAACRNFSGADNSKYFLFDAGTGFDHLVRITVNTVLENFGLGLVRKLIAPGPIPGFPEYNCVPYGPGGQCVEYTTVHPQNLVEEYHPQEGVDYLGPIIWLVSWIQPIGTNPIPEIFHEFGDDNDPEYDEIMQGIFFSADLGPYDFNCDEPNSSEGAPTQCDFYDFSYSSYGDPVRVSMSDSFSSARVGIQAPEPTTLALFALFGASYAVRLRRRNR